MCLLYIYISYKVYVNFASRKRVVLFRGIDKKSKINEKAKVAGESHKIPRNL